MVETSVLQQFVEDVGSTGPIAVEGGRTGWSVGGKAMAETRVIRAPVGVLEHRPEEMTVTALAGTPVDQLHEVLARAGQRTSLIERGGTVGGALAVGHDHLESAGRGVGRHALLQVRYVSAEGRLITGGGPMIKNVSGYDLPRLIVGSLGTLGLIGEVILRTNPIPAESRWLTSSSMDPFRCRQLLRRPSAILWDGWQTWVHLEGHAVDVEFGIRALEDDGRWEPASGPPALPEHRWSMELGQVRQLDRIRTGPFVASVSTGMVFTANPPPPPVIAPGLASLFRRIKQEFDPTGRLNPGRSLEGAS